MSTFFTDKWEGLPNGFKVEVVVTGVPSLQNITQLYALIERLRATVGEFDFFLDLCSAPSGFGPSFARFLTKVIKEASKQGHSKGRSATIFVPEGSWLIAFDSIISPFRALVPLTFVPVPAKTT
jgi:hypothetical protein